jgi:ADP-ribose pyrophosphatase YjhB (NUDIX family)
MKTLKPGRDHIGAGCGVLILNTKGEVLLMKRGPKSKNEAGYWCKPGGSVEYGEKAVDAAKREVYEELGVRVRIIGYLPHTDHILPKDGQHWLSPNFVGVITRGSSRIMEPEKCSEIRWFPLDALPKKLTQTTREPARDYRARKWIRL